MVRKTVKWLLILLAAAGAAGGAGAWYAWVRSDEMIREEILAHLSKIAPNCDIQIGRARFDWDRSIRVRDLTLRPKGQDGPAALSVPEAVIRIDRERFLKDQVVDVQVIRLLRPRLEIVRRADGTWSVEDLLPFRPDPEMPIPEWKIEDATLLFRLEQPGGGDPVVMTLQDADLRLVPSGRRQLIVKGLTDVAQGGPLQVSGRVDLDAGTWSLAGTMSGVNTSGAIAGFALRTSPTLSRQLAALGDRLRETEMRILADGGPEPAGVLPNTVPSLASPHRLPAKYASRSEQFPTGDEASDLPTLDVPALELPGAADLPPRVAANGPTGNAGGEPTDLTGLGLNALVDVRFSIGQGDVGASPDFQVWIDCRDGQIVNPLLPFALRHLRGGLYFDNAKVRLSEVQADGGGTAVRIDADFRLPAGVAAEAATAAAGSPVGANVAAAAELPAAAAGTVKVAVTDLPVSDRYPGRLPPSIERFLQAVRPSGPIDLSGTFDRDDAGRWTVRDFLLRAKKATAVPEAFPYPIHDISGTLAQTAPGRVEARMSGKAGLRPIGLYAVIENPGLEAEVGVQIDVAGLALDETLRSAFPAQTRAAIDTVGFGGFADVKLDLFRPAGLGQKFRWRLGAEIRQGEFEYERFPYRAVGVEAQIFFDSESEIWTFRDVTAIHDRAKIAGWGTYRKPPELADAGRSRAAVVRPVLTSGDFTWMENARPAAGLRSISGEGPPGGMNPENVPPGLTLAVRATHVGLGSDLRAALPPELKRVWEELQPGGVADATLKVRWLPGGEPDVRLSEFDLVNGTLLVRAFPYPLNTVSAKLSYAPGKVEIKDFVAWHDDGTRFQVTGGTLTHDAEGRWLLDLPDVFADEVQLGPDLRRAAPEPLRIALDAADPQGPIGLQGAVQVRGSNDPHVPPTAGWNVTATLVDNRIGRPVELSHVYGAVHCKGWTGRTDGVYTQVEGSVVLDRADVIGNRLENIRGPFVYRDGELEIGSRDILAGGPTAANDPPVPAERRLVADFLGGLLTFDSVVTFGDVPGYIGRATLAGGRLERYAPQLSNAKNLAGVLTGHVNFQGQGTDVSAMTGQGRLRIEPAALYELPVMMQMFSALTNLSGNTPDRTAFKSADIQFRIGNGTFYFPRIDLIGDQLRFEGYGTAGFDGTLWLDFNSRMPRNPIKAVPIVGPLVGAVIDTATRGMIGLEVRGNAAAPVARTVPAKPLGDSTRQFLDALGPQRPPVRRAGPFSRSR